MSLKKITEEIEKLNYQVRTLGNAIDWEKYPLEHLIICMGWSEYDVNLVHDIFKKYDDILTQDLPVNWKEFERAFAQQLDLGYQEIKSIVLAFYETQRWVNVCIQYAKSFDPRRPVELQRII